jgi:hypothetical protein
VVTRVCSWVHGSKDIEAPKVTIPAERNSSERCLVTSSQRHSYVSRPALLVALGTNSHLSRLTSVSRIQTFYNPVNYGEQALRGKPQSEACRKGRSPGCKSPVGGGASDCSCLRLASPLWESHTGCLSAIKKAACQQTDGHRRNHKVSFARARARRKNS